MRTEQFLKDQTGTGESVLYSNTPNTDEVVVQIEITDTATVELRVRIEPNAPWVVIKTFTASGLQVFAAFPQFQLNVTANSGTVNGWAGSR